MNTLIKNGVIVTASDTFKGDVLIKDGIIAQIGTELNIDCKEVIDASNKFVIPGGIDVHTHLNLDTGVAVSTDDFYTGTVAAACGGTTCIIDHLAFGPKGCNLHHQIDVYHGYAKDKAVIDYSFHGVIQHVDENILNEMEALMDEGITSYKIYLTYDYKLTDLEVFKLMMKARDIGAIVTVHPENNDAIQYLREYYSQNGFVEPIYHAKSRPIECEGEAINKMLNISGITGEAPLYIVHLSCKLGLDYIKLARSMGQKNIFAETCPQYLLLDEEKYNDSNNEGLKYIMSPPLRKKFNQNVLWSGIKNGDIQVVATDHCPFNFNIEKQMGKSNFMMCPNGIPGIETRLPLMFSEGVMKNRISINKFVDIVSTSPAKIFGLYPKKGTIAVGSDADIVIIDPKKKIRLSKSILHENVDYTPYEGIDIEGYPVITLSKGKVIVRDNKFIGEKGYGKFIKRKKFSY